MRIIFQNQRSARNNGDDFLEQMQGAQWKSNAANISEPKGSQMEI